MLPLANAHRWPVADVGGRRAVVTQEFSAAHRGVDMMFPRRARDPTGAGTTRDYVVPPGASAVAALGGSVRYAMRAANGWRVRLGHEGVDTLYLHLAAVAVEEGQRVEAGDVLGPVGADPTDPEGLPHLHFEVRIPATTSGDAVGMTPIDPEPWLAGAARVGAGAGAVVLLLLVVALVAVRHIG